MPSPEIRSGQQETGPLAHLEKGEKIKELVTKTRATFLEMIADRSFTISNESTGKTSMVIATGKADSTGFQFIREEGMNHGTLTSTERLLRSPEGIAMIDEILAPESLSEEDMQEIKRELWGYSNPKSKSN